MTDSESELVDEDMEKFLCELFERSGYDFRDYARSSLNRRISRIIASLGLRSLAQLSRRVFSDSELEQQFVQSISVPTTAMFRDPEVFRTLRTAVVPALLQSEQLPVRVWIVGSSTGEEVYSVAILFSEEGLYERSQIYATDFNQSSIRKAREGIFPLRSMQTYTANYLASGGCADFSSYYTSAYGNAVFQDGLKRNIVFAQHNLVTDGSFNEFDIILCRNVLIYFNNSLQDRVYKLIDDSLTAGGFLVLGEKESLRLSTIVDAYQQLWRPDKIFRKM